MLSQPRRCAWDWCDPANGLAGLLVKKAVHPYRASNFAHRHDGAAASPVAHDAGVCVSPALAAAVRRPRPLGGRGKKPAPCPAVRPRRVSPRCAARSSPRCSRDHDDARVDAHLASVNERKCQSSINHCTRLHVRGGIVPCGVWLRIIYFARDKRRSRRVRPARAPLVHARTLDHAIAAALYPRANGRLPLVPAD